MKMEMGESLFYSWLRHVCKCQIVQTNWQPSFAWPSLNEADTVDVLRSVDEYFKTHWEDFRRLQTGSNVPQSLKIFGRVTDYLKVLMDGECDVLGIAISDGELQFYCVDVAYHKRGLGYEDNLVKVLEKCVRNAMMLYNYFGTKKGRVIFASPKINPRDLAVLEPAVAKLRELLTDKGFEFEIDLCYGEAFERDVLIPVFNIRQQVSDTSELFLRSIQMASMFDRLQIVNNNDDAENPVENANIPGSNNTRRRAVHKYRFNGSSYKMGKLALAIVNEYVRNNPDVAETTLLGIFSQKLDFNNKPIVRRLVDLSQQEIDAGRAYVDDSIELADGGEVVVSSQWSSCDMQEFLNTVRNLGFEVVVD